MDRTVKMDLRENINSFTRNLLKNRLNQTIDHPVVITIYLGLESYKNVNASLKDAFTSSFNIEPAYYDTTIKDSQEETETLINDIEEALTDLSSNGKSYNDLYFIFVGVMHDPFFDEDCLNYIDVINETFHELGYLGINLDKIAFYGLFDQKKMRSHNYQHAFAFINKGKTLWNNIFHIEVLFTAKDYNAYSQIIALNTIACDYDMSQSDGEEYHWRSLSLHFLKIPEHITASLLYEIYTRQLDDKNIDEKQWASHVSQVLNNFFDKLFVNHHTNAYRFVPLDYHPPIKKKKRLFHSDDEEEVYNNILKKDDEIERICISLYSNKTIEEEEYKKMITDIISLSTSINKDAMGVEKLLITLLNKEIEQLAYELNNLRPIGSESIYNIDSYLKKVFEYEKEKVIIREKIKIIKTMIDIIDKSDLLKDVINEIVTKNHEYTLALKELCINDYGYMLDSLNISDLPEFTINLSSAEILDKIEHTLVSDYIYDKNQQLIKLDHFLIRTLNSTDRIHVLGEINNNYNVVEPIKYTFLMTPNFYDEIKDKAILNKYTYLNKDINNIYRDNSFYIISSRDYSSNKYIVRYK